MKRSIWKTMLIISILLLLVTDLAAEETDGGTREFLMGFSSWSYGPDAPHVDETYRFLQANGDIYSEQIDDTIPWKEALSKNDFPQEFVSEIRDKVSRRIPSQKLLLSISSLNGDRSGLAEPFGGEMPAELENTKFSDPKVIAAYVYYCRWLIDQFQPDYVIVGMEVNELLNHRPEDWSQYLVFSRAVRKSLKEKYPQLKIAESVTLHKLVNPETSNDDQYRNQVRDFVDDLDFLGVSYHPLFLMRTRASDVRSDLKFLRNWAGDLRIAITETSSHAMKLEMAQWNYRLPATESTQEAFMKALLAEAARSDYLFVIYFAHRDYDLLWETFPQEIKALGKLWRDTGIVDKDGRARKAMSVWRKWLQHK